MLLYGDPSTGRTLQDRRSSTGSASRNVSSPIGQIARCQQNVTRICRARARKVQRRFDAEQHETSGRRLALLRELSVLKALRSSAVWRAHHRSHGSRPLIDQRHCLDKAADML
jgi:hypothetical protein